MNKLKILFLSANPTNTTPLALGEELRDIQKRIWDGEHRAQFEMVIAPAAQIDDVEQALLQHKPTIVHFSGHGTKSDGLIFQGAGAEGKGVGADAIGGLFRLLKKNVRVVILNACYSEPQARAVVQHIDFVVGMKSSVGDIASRKFAASFYRALSFAESVEMAFDLGRSAVKLAGIVEDQDVPVLLVREGICADEVLLVPR